MRGSAIRRREDKTIKGKTRGITQRPSRAAAFICTYLTYVNGPVFVFQSAESIAFPSLHSAINHPCREVYCSPGLHKTILAVDGRTHQQVVPLDKTLKCVNPVVLTLQPPAGGPERVV